MKPCSNKKRKKMKKKGCRLEEGYVHFIPPLKKKKNCKWNTSVQPARRNTLKKLKQNKNKTIKGGIESCSVPLNVHTTSYNKKKRGLKKMNMLHSAYRSLLKKNKKWCDHPNGFSVVPPWFSRRCSANINIARNSSPWFPRGSSVGCPYPLNHTKREETFC